MISAAGSPKRRAIDALRRDKMRAQARGDRADDLGDELLASSSRPATPASPDARAALTLKVVGGLTTDEIARVFLSSEAAICLRRFPLPR